MQHISDDILNLIVDSFTGELTADTTDVLYEWITAAPNNSADYNKLRELWFSAGATQTELLKYDRQRAFNQFLRQIYSQNEYFDQRKSSDGTTELIVHKHPRIFTRNKLLWAAAVSAALVVVAAVSYVGGQSVLKAYFANIIIEAPIGSKINMTLPDGSVVWLNAASRIEYSQGFGVSDRNLKLTGEGCFQVKHNTKLPFIVHSSNLAARDLGTIFTFRDYPTDDNAQIALENGSISVENLMKTGNTVFLKPDQRIILNKKNGVMHVEDYESAKMKRWIDGILVFEGESMDQIARHLEREYGVKVDIASDSIRNLHFFGDFNIGKQNIQTVLEQLSLTKKVRYNMEGDTVKLY